MRYTIFALILGAPVASQSLLVPGQPVQPGQTIQVSYTNTLAIGFPFEKQRALYLLQPTGERITPELTGCSAISNFLAPGRQVTLSFQVPSSGPGSQGSFVLMTPLGDGAAIRLDVGAARAVPAISTYPRRFYDNAHGHHVDFAPSQRDDDWEFANTGATPYTFNQGSITLFEPGFQVPVATLSLAGLTVPAEGVVRLQLPLRNLTPGPYRVRVIYPDPATQSIEVAEHGITDLVETRPAADLHLPGGHIVTPGAALPIQVDSRFLMRTPPPMIYAVAFGYFPGSTPLPGGGFLPLVPDPVLEATLNNGLWGAVSKPSGATTNQGVYCAHSSITYPIARGMTLSHPGLPVFTGLQLRLAALVIDSTSGQFAASQAEMIRFR